MSGMTTRCLRCGATYGAPLVVCSSCGAPISPGDSTLRTGDTIDGKYKIESLLGTGGMGEVYKARHLHLDTFRTVKVMRKSLTADNDYLNRFIREARIAELVHHPNVALVHDFATLPDGTYYMVSEFIVGETARQWLRNHGRMSMPMAVSVALQVLSGLEAIHRAGLLHRDISPDNIMLCSEVSGVPMVKIIDFGIAKVIDGPAADATQIGVFVGNPRYSSPEQLGAIADGEELDGRADLYCLGLVLYELLAGEAPFVSKTPQGYAVKHLSNAPPPLSAAAVTPGLERVVMKALEKNRTRRYSSARELSAALAPYVTESVSITPAQLTKAEKLAKRAIGPPTTTLTPPPQDDQSEEEREWQLARASKERPAVQRFLKHYPHGAHGAEAHALLDEFITLDEVARLADSGDISALTRLVHEHPPTSRVSHAVREAIDRMAAEAQLAPDREAEDWSSAYDEATVEAWTRYLADHSRSRRAPEARRFRDEARDFASATRAGTIVGWRSFLAAWLDSRFRIVAEQHLVRLTAELAGDRQLTSDQTEAMTEAPPAFVLPSGDGEAEREHSAWARAVAQGTKEGWVSYLSNFSASSRMAEARKMFAEASAFAFAQKVDTTAAWREYLQQWPKGRHRTEAEARARTANERKANMRGFTPVNDVIPETHMAVMLPSTAMAGLAAPITPLPPSLPVRPPGREPSPDERRHRMIVWAVAVALTALMCFITIVFAARRWHEIASPPNVEAPSR